MEETKVPGENHRPVACHWQTLSHNVVSSTPCLSGNQTRTVYKYKEPNKSLIRKENLQITQMDFYKLKSPSSQWT